MDKNKLIMLLLLSISNSLFSWNVAFSAAGLLASNFNTYQYIRHLQFFKKRAKDAQPHLLNDHENYKEIIDATLQQYNPDNTEILIYNDKKNNNSFIQGCAIGNKVLLNNTGCAVLNKKNTYFDSQEIDACQGIIGHEIGHIHHNHLKKLNIAYLFTAFSSLVLIPVFSSITNENTNLITKIGVIAAVSASKYVSDTVYTASFTRQLEKQADRYAIKYSNANQLRGLAKHFNKLADKEPQHKHFMNIFGSHPSSKKRAELFKDAAGALD